MAKADILVVDDTAANLKLLVDLLKEAGYLARPTTSGAMAIKSAKLSKPDLILLDINMPGMNGYEVCEQLKADQTLHDVPVIFISALDETMDKVRAFRVGGSDYVTKPFQIEEVLARIETHLTLYHQKREIQQRRQQEQESLQKLDETRQRFAEAYYDSSAPIGALRSLAAQLEQHPADDSSAAQLRQSADNITEMVRRVLDLTHIEIKAPDQYPMLNLAALIKERCRAYAATSFDNRLQIVFENVVESVWVAGDEARLTQIFDNLMTNALKFTPLGGYIHIQLYEEGETVILGVKDNGIGIPESALPYIFDKFYRVDHPQHRQQPGTGLGLSIVRALVEQLHGRVWVESTFGQGASFYVQLPLADLG